jgi:hypothetical protein
MFVLSVLSRKKVCYFSTFILWTGTKIRLFRTCNTVVFSIAVKKEIEDTGGEHIWVGPVDTGIHEYIMCWP